MLHPVVAPVGGAQGPPLRPSVSGLSSLDENSELQDTRLDLTHGDQQGGPGPGGTPGTLVGANAAANVSGREGLLGDGAGSAASSGGTGSTAGGAAQHGGGRSGVRWRSWGHSAREGGGAALLQTATAGPVLFQAATHQEAVADAATPAVSRRGSGSLQHAHTADPSSLVRAAE